MMLDLPIEIWIQIFEYLNPTTLYQIRNVNKRFRIACTKTIEGILRGTSDITKPIIQLEISQICCTSSIHVTLTPIDIDQNGLVLFEPEGQKGFIGLSKLLSQMCESIVKSDTFSNDSGIDLIGQDYFNRNDYMKLTQFLKDCRLGMRDPIPNSLWPSYDLIFGHLLKTLEKLCERNDNQMSGYLQLSLLNKILKVVEMIGPKRYRDPEICTDPSCCDANFTIKLQTHSTLNEFNQKVLENLFQLSDMIQNENWNWKDDDLNLKSCNHILEINENALVSLQTLKSNSETIADIQIRIQPWLLFKP